MSVSLDSHEHTTTNPFSNLLGTISSYDGNVLLAAIISLLLVILFVLLLHLYAKWFLSQARHRSHSSSLSHVLRHDRFRHFHTFTFDVTTPSKGLEPSVISSIPLFVYKTEECNKQGLECVVCLSTFDDNDVGRSLIKCGHCFHVECIDMWLNSHSNCPICRAPVLSNETSTGTSTGTSTVAAAADYQVSSMESVGRGSLNGDNLDDSLAVAIDDDDDDDISASSSIGCSLKRMMSRNRSERKVFPSSNISELPV